MKTELRRIEAMLAQLAQTHPEPMGAVPLPQAIASIPSAAALRPPFKTSQSLQPLPRFATAPPAPGADTAWSDTALKETASFSGHRSPRAKAALKMPTLPSLAVPENPQPTVKAALPTDILKAIEGLAVGWQNELQQCLHQIQAVYAEGPIVDGWLETYATGSQDGQPMTLEAKAPVNATNDVAPLDRSIQVGDRASNVVHTTAGRDTAPGCRLCGFNDNGQLWFRHCPAAQVTAVSLAIARCERMKQLLTRKQYLDTQLGKLSEALTVVYGRIAGP